MSGVESISGCTSPFSSVAEVISAQLVMTVFEAIGLFTHTVQQCTAPDIQAPALYLIARTLSKMGLAGLRLGTLVGPPAWIAELDKLRLPYNINTLTQASAIVGADGTRAETAFAGHIHGDHGVERIP